MSYKGAFSYKNYNIQVVRLEEGINLRVEKLDSNIARIRFVDADQNPIAVPNGIQVRSISTGEPAPLLHGSFLVAWVDNYQVEQYGEVIIQLENQGQHAICTSLPVSTIQT